MRQQASGHGVLGRALVLALVLALLAAACGGGDTEEGGASAEESATLDVPCRAGFDPENPPPREPPSTGGTLVYGVESETDGWDPSSNRWAISGLEIAEALYDTLTKPVLGEDGGIEFAPYLAESVEHNEDYTEWTITVRPDVFFHDGTPLTSTAVKLSLDAYRESVLTGAALSNIQSVEELDDRSVRVAMAQPWVPFPQYLSSQIGVVMAPAMFDDPNPSQNPIGTGPFRFESWQRDKELNVVRFDDYWQTDEFGNQLPYLDGIVFRPLPDPTSRRQALDAGDVQVIHTFNANDIKDFRTRAESGSLNAYESCAWGEDEEFLVMYNNAKPPFDNQLAREAVARAIDRDTVTATLFGDVFQIATGPWAPGSPWHLAPEEPNVYNPDLARSLAQQYEEETGEEISFTLGAPIGIPEALQSQQLIKSYLDEVGIEVDLQTIEFATYVADAVLGNYQANIWRQYGAPDPDGEYVWWHIDNVRPPGELSLNIARIQDQELSDALDRGRTTDDPEQRREAYAEVQRIFRENFYLGWSVHAFWSVAAAPEVHDVVNWRTPDGRQGVPLTGGTHPLAQVWLGLN